MQLGAPESQIALTHQEIQQQALNSAQQMIVAQQTRENKSHSHFKSILNDDESF